MAESSGEVSDQPALKTTGPQSSLPSSHVGARSPPLCLQSAGRALKGWNRLSNKRQGENRYGMEAEALERGKVWRLMGGNRRKETLLERVKY